MVVVFGKDVYTNGCGCCSTQIKTREEALIELKQDLDNIKDACILFNIDFTEEL